MSDFKAKMHKIQFPLHPRQTPLGELQGSPDLAVFMGPSSKGEDVEGKSREKCEAYGLQGSLSTYVCWLSYISLSGTDGFR